ncbi:hypothetical protein [Kribbella sindirgiensis]|uniref:hypothetical protein n=1 Tax=Kribbella sindirgiensis TaxID=1124744 RepID=UPI0013F48D0C|nr:hypothetical protein [Kribbella sindirgiensis]
MKRSAVFVGGPRHGELDEVDWTVRYLEPTPVWRRGFFGRTTLDIDHTPGIYFRTRYWFFGRLVTVMLDEKVEPGSKELDRLLADALLNDKAKTASVERAE